MATSSRVMAAAVRRRHAVTLPIWRGYATASRPNAASAVDNPPDLVEGSSSTTKTDKDGVEAYPPHPEWVMARRPEYYNPPIHPRRFGVHVATLTFTAHNPDKDQLPLATGFALQAAWNLGIACTRPSALKVERDLLTVLKSGFVHKKSQENFWRLTHRWVVKAYDANEEVVNRWINYLVDESIAANVTIKADRFTYRPLGWGAELEQRADKERETKLEEEAATEERVRRLAERLIETELAPRAAAAEQEDQLKPAGPKKLGTLEEASTPSSSSSSSP